LSYLKVSGCKFLTDELLRPVILANTRLVSLDLSDCHHLTSGILQTVSVRCTQLECLILRDCHWVSKEAIEYHAYQQGWQGGGQAQFDQVGSRRFSEGHQGVLVSSTGLLSTSSRRRVGGGQRVNSVPEEDKLSQKGCLKEIDLTGCWELNDKVVINLVSRFPKLKKVTLGNIYSLTDLTMRALAAHTKKLSELDIRGCWRISDGGVQLVAEYCRSLSQLYVKECRDITEQSLSRLRRRGVRIDLKLDSAMLRIQKKLEYENTVQV